MRAITLHTKDTIAQVLRREPYRNLYALGDLDPFFWDYTQWYGLIDNLDHIQQIALLYTAIDAPVLQAIELPDETHSMANLLSRIQHLLPRRIYAHLTEGLLDLFKPTYQVEPHGIYLKMALHHQDMLANIDTSEAVPLTTEHCAELEALYRVSYPGNWFDARMLETEQYFGIYRDRQLVSVAGIHVYSAEYKVAALGNITTHPDYRGQSLAQITTAALCQSLLKKVSHIGLNVHAENKSAIRCYQHLGFEEIARYGEYSLTAV